MGRTHAEWTPGLLEQVWRIKRGLPATPKHGLLAQAERAKRGVPKTSKEGLLAQVERKKRERLARGPTRPPRRRGWSLYPPWSLPPDWDDPSRLGYVSPEALYEMVYGPPKIREPRRPEARLAATPEQVSRAKSKHWIIHKDRNEAEALPGATLWWLAWAITGDANDYRLIKFEGEPKRLMPGDTVNITLLIMKAAGGSVEPPKEEKPPARRPTDYSQKSLEALAQRAAVKHGVPPAIFKALIQQESKWQIDALSSEGALGLTQLMPDTAIELGLKVDVDSKADERLDPARNIDAGARYLRAEYERMYEGRTELERWRLALAAYNCGHGNLNRCLRRMGKAAKPASVVWREIAPDAPQQTRRYVRNILGESGNASGYAKEYGYGR